MLSLFSCKGTQKQKSPLGRFPNFKTKLGNPKPGGFHFSLPENTKEASLNKHTDGVERLDLWQLRRET